ncbi:phosphodiester glycosidase family protein [Paenibacillus sp. FSL K6-2524]|uniref:phosphodiester glycosidase family protein n=1 Tax=Paenibacillus sp. FSL K6-2524 TaxID=2954516 RepID=UPI0030FC04A6
MSKFQDSNNLLSAFADNSFGRNIIENTSEIASNNDAIFAINGDYYGFRNDGVIIRNGTLYRDSPVRTALALFNDGAIQSFDETQISSSELLADGVTNTLSFGPVLIEDGKMVEDFSHVMIDTNFGNRSIQGANPRTGIGMIAPNHYIFIVVDGRKEGYSRGMTLPEFAQVFADLGCTEAYNLDGGGSSTMYFMGRIVNNPQGKNRERGVSDILYIKER